MVKAPTLIPRLTRRWNYSTGTPTRSTMLDAKSLCLACTTGSRLEASVPAETPLDVEVVVQPDRPHEFDRVAVAAGMGPPVVLVGSVGGDCV